MQLKRLLTLIIKIIISAFVIAYPFVVFFAFENGVAFRFIGLFLLAIVALSFIRNNNKVLFGLGLILCLLIMTFNTDIFLRLYPVLMNGAICAIFALSLNKTPLITKYALKMHHDLTDQEIKYTKNATLAWAIFMACNTIISFITLFLPMKIWVLYNGFISYILISVMMISEYITRKWVLRVQSNK